MKVSKEERENILRALNLYLGKFLRVEKTCDVFGLINKFKKTNRDIDLTKKEEIILIKVMTYEKTLLQARQIPNIINTLVSADVDRLTENPL